MRKTFLNPAKPAVDGHNGAALSVTDTPVRVLHLTAASDAGGISRYIFDLCQAMHAQGHFVAVAGQRGPWHSLFESAPWPWIDLPLKGGPWTLLKAARQLRNFLQANPVDVIHVHYRRPVLVARRAATPLGIPILYTLHLTDIPLFGPWRWLSDFGDHVHAPSRQARTWLIYQAHIPDTRITLIPHGVDPNRFPLTTPQARQQARQQLGLHPRAIVAAYVGRFEAPKNEDWIIDLTQAAMTDPYLQKRLLVVMAGGGPDKPLLEQRIYRLGLSRRIRLLDYTDPLIIYQAADLLLLPSAREGFSLVCAEAMCTGCAVVRTRTAGTDEMIIEGVTGRSCPIDRQAFIETALRTLRNRLAMHRMGQTAAEHIRRELTFQRQLQATIDLYRHLAGQVPLSPASPSLSSLLLSSPLVASPPPTRQT